MKESSEEEAALADFDGSARSPSSNIVVQAKK